MHTTGIVRFIVLGLVVLAVGLGTATADAASDRKSYPGTMCSRVGQGTETSDLRYENEASGSSYVAGTVANYSTTYTWTFICPIVSDCAATYGGGAWVSVVDWTSAAYVYCRFSVRDAISGSGSWGTWDYTGPYGSSRDSQYPVEINPQPTTTSYSYPYKFLTCVVPNAETAYEYSRIVAYQIDENC